VAFHHPHQLVGFALLLKKPARKFLLSHFPAFDIIFTFNSLFAKIIKGKFKSRRLIGPGRTLCVLLGLAAWIGGLFFFNPRQRLYQ
jgi:hypothetical protein